MKGGMMTPLVNRESSRANAGGNSTLGTNSSSLSLPYIPRTFAEIKQAEAEVDPAYEEFKKNSMGLTKINLDFYKENQMKRRINTFLARHGANDYNEFVDMLSRDNELLERFVDYVTINVTEFFRTPEHWQLLEDDVLPQLIKRFGPNLIIWSVACSTGEEPYSLAMSLEKCAPGNNARIIATDIDNNVLRAAKEGLYTDFAMETAPEHIREKFFTKAGTNWRISQEIKDRVEFHHLDVTQESFPKGCHLIVCRNVLIYFTQDAKEKIFLEFHDSLAQGGCLFLGKTEQIVNYKRMNLQKVRPCFYFK